MGRTMSWEDIIAEVGEDTGLSFGKVEDTLELAVYVAKKQYKLSTAQAREWIRNIAANNMPGVIELTLTTISKKDDILSVKAKLEMEADYRKTCRLLESAIKFALQWGGNRGN